MFCFESAVKLFFFSSFVYADYNAVRIAHGILDAGSRAAGPAVLPAFYLLLEPCWRLSSATCILFVTGALHSRCFWGRGVGPAALPAFRCHLGLDLYPV
jgi:hypothetical protein